MLHSLKIWKYRIKNLNFKINKRNWKIGRCIIRTNWKKWKNWDNIQIRKFITVDRNRKHEKSIWDIIEKIGIVWNIIKIASV